MPRGEHQPAAYRVGQRQQKPQQREARVRERRSACRGRRHGPDVGAPPLFECGVGVEIWHEDFVEILDGGVRGREGGGRGFRVGRDRSFFFLSPDQTSVRASPRLEIEMHGDGSV